MKIYLFCGGPSSEHDVSLNSAQEILIHINKDSYESITLFYIDKEGYSYIIPVNLKTFDDKDYRLMDWKDNDYQNKATHRFETVTEALKKIRDERDIFALVAAMHGEFGENGELQKLLEEHSIPFNGSNSSASALAMHKIKTNEAVSSLDGVLIPQTAIISEETLASWTLYPAIVKPVDLGSSIGIFIAESKDSISLDTHAGYMIQELLSGTEFACGVLQKKDGSFVNIPPIEIIPQGASFFDYEAKYVPSKALEITPPESMSEDDQSMMINLSQKIHSHIGCRTYSRSDFIKNESGLYFIEINTLPGFTANSLLPKEAQAAGMSFSKLIDFIITESQ